MSMNETLLLIVFALFVAFFLRRFVVARRNAERVAEEARRRETELLAAEEAARRAAAEAARREAERLAAAEIARQAAEEAARREAERLAAEEAVRRENERKAAEEAARREAERKSAEQAAQREAARQVAEEVARREAARQAAEKATRLAAEEAARHEAARRAAELAARREAERKAAEEAVRREAERQAAEETARLEAERRAAERIARRAAAQQAAEEAARQAIEEARLRALVAATPPVSVHAKIPEQTVVMLADDSKVVRVKTGRLLAAHKYQVVLAEDGLDAARQIESAIPDVLITDVDMPGMGGLELVRQLRGNQRTVGIPIIMITSDNEKLSGEAAASGVDVLLGKPYPEEQLIAHIQTLMNGRRGAQHARSA